MNSILFLLCFLIGLPSFTDEGFIHEPYWKMNDQQLEDYAKSIVKTIEPLIIDAEQLEHGRVNDKGEKVPVRKVAEFGRVLPNIFLRQALHTVGEKNKTVPRIYLIPKANTELTFEFLLPHKKMLCNSGHNCVQVLSNSFTIYQEFIKGEGEIGNMSFAMYGHNDFNAKQIIRSTSDHKEYLIDTKESKNFFIPEISPNADAFFVYWLFEIGRNLPQERVAFAKWQRTQKANMIRHASNNFSDKKSITVNLGFLKQLDLSSIEAIDYRKTLFDDDNEPERYFAKTEENIGRYLFLGRFDLARNLLKEGNLSLDNINIPSVSSDTVQLLNPVDFILKSKIFSNVQKYSLLKYFKGFAPYFSGHVLLDALKTRNREIFSFVQQNVAKPDTEILGKSIMVHALEQFLSEPGNKDTNYQILSDIIAKSGQKDIEKALQLLVSKESQTFFGKRAQSEKNDAVVLLMNHLTFVSGSLIDAFITYDDRALLDAVLTHTFDFKTYLYEAVKKVKDPRHNYMRRIHGDNSPIDEYWYDLVRKIIDKKEIVVQDEADSAIDLATAHALANGKVNLLCDLLKYLPEKALRTHKQLEEIRDDKYGLMMDQATSISCPLLVQLLTKHHVPLSTVHIRNAVARRGNQEVIKALAQSPSINLAQALDESLDARNRSAADTFLRTMVSKNQKPSSRNYHKIFASSFTKLKDLALNIAGEDRSSLLDRFAIENLVKNNQLATLQYLIENKVNLGDILAISVRHVIFAKDHRIKIDDGEWNNLLNSLSEKDLPAFAIDAALASALVNSKILIVQKFVSQIGKISELPKSEQRLRRVIQELIRDPYNRDRHFEEALKMGSPALVQMYLEEGMQVKEQHMKALPSDRENSDQIRSILQNALQSR